MPVTDIVLDNCCNNCHHMTMRYIIYCYIKLTYKKQKYTQLKLLIFERQWDENKYHSILFIFPRTYNLNILIKSCARANKVSYAHHNEMWMNTNYWKDKTNYNLHLHILGTRYTKKNPTKYSLIFKLYLFIQSRNRKDGVCVCGIKVITISYTLFKEKKKFYISGAVLSFTHRWRT